MAECSVIMRTGRRQIELKTVHANLGKKIEIKNQDEAEILSKLSGDYSPHRSRWSHFSISILFGEANVSWTQHCKI